MMLLMLTVKQLFVYGAKGVAASAAADRRRLHATQVRLLRHRPMRMGSIKTMHAGSCQSISVSAFEMMPLWKPCKGNGWAGTS